MTNTNTESTSDAGEDVNQTGTAPVETGDQATAAASVYQNLFWNNVVADADNGGEGVEQVVALTDPDLYAGTVQDRVEAMKTCASVFQAFQQDASANGWTGEYVSAGEVIAVFEQAWLVQTRITVRQGGDTAAVIAEPVMLVTRDGVAAVPHEGALPGCGHTDALSSLGAGLAGQGAYIAARKHNSAITDNVIPAGVYEIGSEFDAGLYRLMSEGGTAGSLQTFSDAEAFAANQTLSSIQGDPYPSSVIVDLQDGVIEVSSYLTPVAAGAITVADTGIAYGTYLIGSDISPGVYTLTPINQASLSNAVVIDADGVILTQSSAAEQAATLDVPAAGWAVVLNNAALSAK